MALLEQMALEHDAEPCSVKPLCETRWTVRVASIASILKQYGVLKDTLEDIGESASWKGTQMGAKAADKLGKTTTLFELHVARPIFGVCEELARGLQAEGATHAGS